MDTLRKQLRIAHRRLLVQQFLLALPWCLTATLLLALVAVIVPKLFPLPLHSAAWTWGWLGGAVLAGFVSAFVWTWAHRRTTLEAAIEIDHRFQLKERVSSMLSLDPEERETEAGRALINDAVRRISGIDVRERFGLSLGRRAWLPIIPALLALSVALFVSDRGLHKEAQATTTAAEEKKAIENASKVLKRRFSEAKKKAEQRGLKDAGDLFKKLEEAARELGDRDDVNQRKATVKLNDLAKQLEERRKKLGGGEQIRQQLKKLSKLSKGPADKLADALRKGEFKGAVQELKKLQEQIEGGKLSKEQQEQLAKQMEEMQQKLKQLADAHKQAMDNLQQQIDQARQQGDQAQADRLQQQLDKLAQQMPQMNGLQEMARQMQQAADNMKQGNMQDAKQSLQQMAQNLGDMQEQLEELDMVNEMIDQLGECKDAMCKACQGGGQGQKPMQGLAGGKGDGKGKKPGGGLGPGRGQGDRPLEEDQAGTYDSRVRQKLQGGTAVLKDFVEGPNVKGRALEEVKAGIQAARAEESDPLTGQRLPKAQREHAREYFETFQDDN